MPITRKHRPRTRCFSRSLGTASSMPGSPYRSPAHHETTATTASPAQSPALSHVTVPAPSPNASPILDPTPKPATLIRMRRAGVSGRLFPIPSQTASPTTTQIPNPYTSPAANPAKIPVPSPATSPATNPYTNPAPNLKALAGMALCSCHHARSGLAIVRSRWRARNTSHLSGSCAFQRPLVTSVGGRDVRVEQERFHGFLSQSGGTAQPDQARSRPAHQAGGYRWYGPGRPSAASQCLPGRRISTQYGQDRSPAGPRDRASRVITQVARTASASSGRNSMAAAARRVTSTPPFGLMRSGTALLRQVTTTCSPGRSASLIWLIAGPRTSSGISSSPSKIGRISPDASSASAWVGSVRSAGGVGEGRVVDQKPGDQPVPETLTRRVPGRHRGQDRNGPTLGPADKQVQHKPDHQNSLARARLTQHN